MFNLRVSIFIKKGRVKKIVILRAPYRYKLGRLQLMHQNYSVYVHMSIYSHYKHNNIIDFIFNKNVPMLTTSLLNLHSVLLITVTNNPKNFLLKNF